MHQSGNNCFPHLFPIKINVWFIEEGVTCVRLLTAARGAATIQKQYLNNVKTVYSETTLKSPRVPHRDVMKMGQNNFELL